MLAPVRSLAAEVPWSWTPEWREIYDALNPLTDSMLRHDRVGTSRPWKTPCGINGRIILESGGDRAGSRVAVIGVSSSADRSGRHVNHFRYRKIRGRGWVLIC
ncbi:hypothetical protein FHS31_003034 [Sphingomonas vulcanisoli]|uniref:Uncharacterized protein n=1 Tax=Sphingomonas vulcanisoli TaxID=1658060 RepID=A0ABX0TY46_9SPHN|nr:hypothetical protein [Sphingomonas vulcanisoli]NIJ09402.1 hypothetical protein [Sphingomonas vulcanisoli]